MKRDIELVTMKMLPELENCEEDPDRFRSGPSSLQSSISKRANSTRKSLIGITDGVQQRLQSGHNNMQRINEEEVVSSDEAPREANLNENSERRSKQRCSTHQSAPSETQWSEWSSRVERLESALHRNYYTIAYSIVLIAYLAGFAEYLYFRLTSIINPEHLVFHPPCEGKANRKIGKDGFHYGVSICAFIGIAVFQLMCFFGLTISEKWTNVKSGSSRRRQSTPEDEQREEFADFIRTKISSTMYRVFACYAICSIINCAIIFYMVGIQDSLGDIVSTILLYVFDALVIIYFIAFPLTTAIYHPYVHCLTRRGAAGSKFILPAISNPNDVKTKSSTLESHINDSDLKSDVEPRNVSLLGQHVTQNVGEVPVLENYLHSPRRVAQRSVETGGATSTSNQPRFSTLV